MRLEDGARAVAPRRCSIRRLRCRHADPRRARWRDGRGRRPRFRPRDRDRQGVGFAGSDVLSASGRRMCQTAANLIDHVVPSGVPLRQWVLTLPHPLRYRLAYDGKLLGAVCRIFVDSVLGWYRRRLTEDGAMKGKSGVVTVIQRTASDLRLHPHFHAVFLDGVYVQSPSGELEFVELPRLRTSEVADVLQVVRARILRCLERRGVIEAGDELTMLDDELSEREPALAQLARAAVSGLDPAGPELRRRPAPVALRGRPGVEIPRPLCAQELGFNLHAATRAGGLDDAGREALLKYVLRPPIASERVQQGPDGLVRIALKRAFSDGTIAIDLDPLSLLCRLCASVPAPKLHTVRYAGVLAAHCKWRSLIIPAPPDDAPPEHPNDDRPPPMRSRSMYRPWAELLKRTFGFDVEQCLRCGGRMRLVALVTAANSIARILSHLGEPAEPPARATARGPPYFATRAVRRKPAEQTALFE